jgi:hypothetical protein
MTTCFIKRLIDFPSAGYDANSVPWTALTVPLQMKISAYSPSTQL